MENDAAPAGSDLSPDNPARLAAEIATADSLSNGRLICGVGVGWWEEELSLLGVPYRQRGRQADEMIQVFKALSNRYWCR